MRNTRPRTFEEVVAAQDPTKMASLTRGDRFVDPSVNAFHGEAIEVNLYRFRLAKFPNGNETLDGCVHADWLDENAITNLHMSLHATASLRGMSIIAPQTLFIRLGCSNVKPLLATTGR